MDIQIMRFPSYALSRASKDAELSATELCRFRP
jgi:hypothetical protein